MDKKSAKRQFNQLTKDLDIEHTFSFDEAWDFLSYKRAMNLVKDPTASYPVDYTKEQFRNGVFKVQEIMLDNIERVKDIHKFNPVKNIFTDGQLVREIFNPAGELIVTAIHKISHPYFLLKGEMSIMTEDGEERITAPHYGITKAGTKRIIYAHTDCIFITVHPTDKDNPDEVLKDVTVESYEELV
tara:strand:- start:6208 stop:6765 length:558 start_codon:yes stop_codon:yes gene_type:complete